MNKACYRGLFQKLIPNTYREISFCFVAKNANYFAMWIEFFFAFLDCITFPIQDSKNCKKNCYPGQQKIVYCISRIAKSLNCFAILDSKKCCYPGEQKLQIVLLSRIAKIVKKNAIQDSKNCILYILDAKNVAIVDIKSFAIQDSKKLYIVLLSWIAKSFAI